MDGFLRAEFSTLVQAMEMPDGQQGKEAALRIVEYLGGQRSVVEGSSPTLAMSYILALMIARGYL